MNPIPVIIDCTGQSLAELGRSFNATLHENSISISNDRMRGFSKRVELESGVYAQTWEIELFEEMEFKKVVDETNAQPFYCLHYFFSPGSGLITVNDERFEINNLNKVNALLSWDTSVCLQFKPGDLVRSLTLIFSKKWLVHQYMSSHGLLQKVPHWLECEKSAFFPAETSKAEQISASEMFTQINQNDSIFQIKGGLFRLIDSKLKLIEGHILLRKNLFHDEVVIQVENKIMKALTSEMPNIQELAKEFYISQSTLTRHFLQFYEQNIYEYYLHQKMKLARQMLVTSNARVSEVANSLGYKSSSHFVYMFKKLFNISPGQLKKMRPNPPAT
jgi:AraC-like DNA-binding protein